MIGKIYRKDKGIFLIFSFFSLTYRPFIALSFSYPHHLLIIKLTYEEEKVILEYAQIMKDL